MGIVCSMLRRVMNENCVISTFMLFLYIYGAKVGSYDHQKRSVYFLLYIYGFLYET